jgi:hypothetical protein
MQTYSNLTYVRLLNIVLAIAANRVCAALGGVLSVASPPATCQVLLVIFLGLVEAVNVLHLGDHRHLAPHTKHSFTGCVDDPDVG